MYRGQAMRRQRPLVRRTVRPEEREEDAKQARPVVLMPVFWPQAPSYWPTSPNACCDQAVQQRCVCQGSWSCPVHGNWCFGSHD